MAYDIFLGHTSRDWSCGNVAAPVVPGMPRQQADMPQLDSKTLAATTRREIDANTREMIRLTNLKRLPEVERKAFGVFFKKWLTFNETHREGFGEKFEGPDYVSLWNFREANKRFTDRLTVFANMAKTPLKTPVSQPVAQSVVPSTALVQFRPEGSLSPVSPRPWGWLLGLGLGLAGLGFIVGKGR